ncbi:class I SAM-dependent methyltransferase [bacterium]|nr:class I SAM-dependent methyltransferase [bacterium]
MLLRVNPREFLPALEAELPDVDAQKLGSLAEYLAIVEHYRRVLNLTAFAGAEQLTRELVGEAARLLELGPIEPGWKVLDLGSGVGTPVIPLAILCPEASFIGIESRERRAVYLQQARARLRLENLSFINGRVEELSVEHAMAYDLVTARAFAQPEQLLRLAMPLLRTSGELRGYLSGVQRLDPELLAELGLELAGMLEYSSGGGLSGRVVYRLTRGERGV